MDGVAVGVRLPPLATREGGRTRDFSSIRGAGAVSSPAFPWDCVGKIAARCRKHEGARRLLSRFADLVARLAIGSWNESLDHGARNGI